MRAEPWYVRGSRERTRQIRSFLIEIGATDPVSGRRVSELAIDSCPIRPGTWGGLPHRVGSDEHRRLVRQALDAGVRQGSLRRMRHRDGLGPWFYYVDARTPGDES